jgi:hypothetical protein
MTYSTNTQVTRRSTVLGVGSFSSIGGRTLEADEASGPISNIHQNELDSPSLTVHGANQKGEYAEEAKFPLEDYIDIGAAINDAISQIKATGRKSGEIQLPAGEFKFSTPILVDVNISLIGRGRKINSTGWGPY